MKLCAVHRFIMNSALDHGGNPPWPTRYHLERCSGCQVTWNRLIRIHGLLAEKGAEVREETGRSQLGPYFPKKGPAVDPHARRVSRPIWPRIWRPLITLAAATLILVVGIRLNKPVPKFSGQKTAEPMLEVRTSIDSLAAVIAETSMSNPLEEELQGLISTARSAALFLGDKIKIL